MLTVRITRMHREAQLSKRLGYTNTTIRLASPDMSFAKTAKLDRVDATALRTTDNGLTWKIDTINVRQTRF
jgi:hypothetical protein